MALDFIERWNQSATGSFVVSLLVVVGLTEAFKSLWRIASGVYIYLLRPGKNIKRYGSWAVVTGATDGIGRAYAEGLAKQGLNIVLISRTKEKLDAAAAEISSKFKVQTKAVVADFGQATSETWDAIKTALEPLDIGVLINNVGVSYDHASYLDELDDDRMADLVTINIVALNKMTKLVLPILRKKKKGAIVNIGSAAGTIAPSDPFYSVYAGSKAYVDMFSKSLALEYAPLGISVQNQAPLFVTTKLAKIRRPTPTIPTPKVWVAHAIKHIGYEATSSPFPAHGAMWGFLHNLPEWLSNIYLYQHGWDMRRRYLKKVARNAKAQ